MRRAKKVIGDGNCNFEANPEERQSNYTIKVKFSLSYEEPFLPGKQRCFLQRPKSTKAIKISQTKLNPRLDIVKTNEQEKPDDNQKSKMK